MTDLPSPGTRPTGRNRRDAPPTPEQVVRWITELTSRYKDQRQTVETIREMRRLTWKVNVPERLEKVTGLTGYVYRAADIADELLTLPTLYTSKLPTLTVTADGRGDTDELTTRLETATEAALFADCGTRAEGPPTHERLFDGVFEGAAWTKLVRDPQGIWSDYLAKAKAGPDATKDDGTPVYTDDKDEPDDEPSWRRGSNSPNSPNSPKPTTRQPKRSKHQKYLAATEKAKRLAGVPIRWDFVDCMNLLPIYEGDVLRAVIEVQQRSLSQVFYEQGLGFDSEGQICPADTAVLDWETRCDGNATIDLIQYWDDTWQSFLVRYAGGFKGAQSGYGGHAERLPGYTMKHGYGLGRPPYWVSLGSTMNFEFGRLASWSAAETKRPAVEYLSFLRTIRAYLGVRDAIPPMAEITPEGGQMLGEDPETPAGPEVYEAGMKYRLRPGQSLLPIVLPDTTATLQQEIQATAMDIASRGPTRITGSLEGAGEAMATAFERDRARYNQHEASIVKHLREVTLALWTLLEGLDEPVYVRSSGGASVHTTIKPSDFANALDPQWTLHVDSMSADIVREQYLARRVQNKTLGQNQAIERQGDNVNEVMQAIAEQTTRESDTYMKAQEAEILAHWGRGEWADLQQQAEQLVAVAGQQQPGQPPVEGAPGVALPAGSDGATSAGVSVQSPPQPGIGAVPPGMPATPSVAMGAAQAGVHGGQPGG